MMSYFMNLWRQVYKGSDNVKVIKTVRSIQRVKSEEEFVKFHLPWLL